MNRSLIYSLLFDLTEKPASLDRPVFLPVDYSTQSAAAPYASQAAIPTAAIPNV
ncbi:hypothetical protein [Paraburkholderia rhizosphaerae]|uniref:hypothetical protein n=1 Tax=Paraburkholderia rhizosphaerae TaxID=480658 RepID=UPI001416F296|nr:hypothetical protein [Paraburkholderia rhizosphaerae]